MQSGGGTIGVSNRIRLRGPTSINLSNDPLLVIDGLVSNNNSSNFSVGVGGATTSRLDDINPQDIEDIQVLKGAAATALYGTGAANGVIQITTKRGKAGKARWGIYTEAGSERSLIPEADPLVSTNYRQIGRGPNRPARQLRTRGADVAHVRQPRHPLRQLAVRQCLAVPHRWRQSRRP